jgi:hypothetical protein
MLSGPQSRYVRRGEEKILDPTATRTPTTLPSNPQFVAIPNALFGLLIYRIVITKMNGIFVSVFFYLVSKSEQ